MLLASSLKQWMVAQIVTKPPTKHENYTTNTTEIQGIHKSFLFGPTSWKDWKSRQSLDCHKHVMEEVVGNFGRVAGLFLCVPNCYDLILKFEATRPISLMDAN